MRRHLFCLMSCLTLFAIILISTQIGICASIGNQAVSYEIQAINEISVNGSPNLTVNTATAGSEPDSDIDTGSYNITSNGTDKKITGVIDTDMPANVTLKVTLGAPTGASSLGQVTLSSTAADLVNGITKTAESSLSITYELSATVDAGIVASGSRTVTYTITDAS